MPPAPTRIVYLCLEPARQGHAVYTHVMEMIKGLKEDGYDVHLFAPHYPEDQKLPGFLGRLFQMVKVQYHVCCTMKRGDILYIRWHPLTVLTYIFAKMKKIHLVQEVNGPYEDLFIAWPLLRFARPLFTYFMRLQLRGADHVFPVTKGLSTFVENEGKHHRITVVSNGVNTDHFHPNAPLPTHPYALPKRYALYFGTFAQWHGLPRLLSVAASPFWPKNVDLIIVGDGFFRRDVEHAARTFSHIHYLGRLPYDHIPGIVSRAFLSIMPFENTHNRADTEFAPLKLFESMACGVPILSSPVGGIDHFLEHYACGVSMPFDDADAVARFIHHLSTQDLSHYGANGRAASEQYFSWKAQSQKVIRVLKTMD